MQRRSSSSASFTPPVFDREDRFGGAQPHVAFLSPASPSSVDRPYWRMVTRSFSLRRRPAFTAPDYAIIVTRCWAPALQQGVDANGPPGVALPGTGQQPSQTRSRYGRGAILMEYFYRRFSDVALNALRRSTSVFTRRH
jgi:hypothetical protein